MSQERATPVRAARGLLEGHAHEESTSVPARAASTSGCRRPAQREGHRTSARPPGTEEYDE